MPPATSQRKTGKAGGIVGYISEPDLNRTKRQSGLAAQASQIAAFCRKYTSYNLTKIYSDSSNHGTAMDARPALRLLLRDARKKRFSIVMVPRMDSMGADALYVLWIEKELRKSGVELYSIADSCRRDDPARKMALQIISAFAEYERARDGARQLCGRKRKLEAGGYAGGRPAYGYSVKAGRLVINAEEAEVVRRIRGMRMGRMSFGRIAAALNGAGVRTKTGKSFHASTVRYMLDNRTYRGIIRYGERRRGAHEPI